MKLVRSIATLSFAVSLAWPVSGAIAQEQSDNPKSLGSNTKKTSSKSGKKSLGDIAAGVKLKGSGDSSKSVTISDHNLGELSKQGTISQGGGVTAGGVPEGAKPATPGTASADAQASLQQNYAEQVAKVKAIEQGLAEFDKQVAEQDPHFANGPQNRAPGTRAPDDLTREKVNADLAAERQKLESLRKQAQKEGVELKEPPVTDPK